MWIIAAISSYFFSAINAVVDRYLLVTSIPNPRIYAFYLGFLSSAVLLLAPFVGFFIPDFQTIIIGLSAGFSFSYGLFWFYKALSIYEVSRVTPAIGGLTPIFGFLFIYIFSGGQETLSGYSLIAFLFLTLGSVLISWQRKRAVNIKSFGISFLAAFLISLSFVLTKYLFSVVPFWQGLMWKGLGGLLLAILFLLIFPEIKREVLHFQKKGSAKTGIIFIANQSLGAFGAILQNCSIAWAPLVYVSFINALQGVQYVFILILSVVISLKMPKILKEEIDKQTLLHKIFAILLIIIGLIILAKVN